MRVAGVAVDRPDLVTQRGPGLLRRVIERVGPAEDRHIDDPPSAAPIEDGVQIRNVRSAVATRHDRDADHAVASRFTLSGHRVEPGDRGRRGRGDGG